MHQRLGGVHARPLDRRNDQAFLGAMTEMVLQSTPLGFRLVGDDDSVVAPLPEGSPPVAEPSADLLRDVAAYMVHEPRQLLLVMDDTQAMPVVGGPNHRAEFQRRDFQGPADDADHDFVEAAGIRRRQEQRTGADHPAGDFDEDAVLALGYEARGPAHLDLQSPHLWQALKIYRRKTALRSATHAQKESQVGTFLLLFSPAPEKADAPHRR